jgi:hypothetical protein
MLRPYNLAYLAYRRKSRVQLIEPAIFCAISGDYPHFSCSLAAPQRARDLRLVSVMSAHKALDRMWVITMQYILQFPAIYVTVAAI